MAKRSADGSTTVGIPHHKMVIARNLYIADVMNRDASPPAPPPHAPRLPYLAKTFIFQRS